ncbi:hypothetical protein EVAR_89156_1 [Eumeta japonica]|uniref:Uncharacterized protein n=1 Tax=Eumeta variegata TaxID=151549 RepID=A0A4C1Z506_EUMVA|nr:hypothetical protein EVAR_89156_1 [Eumeta japonica]
MEKEEEEAGSRQDQRRNPKAAAVDYVELKPLTRYPYDFKVTSGLLHDGPVFVHVDTRHWKFVEKFYLSRTGFLRIEIGPQTFSSGRSPPAPPLPLYPPPSSPAALPPVVAAIVLYYLNADNRTLLHV